MSKSPAERIGHYHTLLVRQHRFVGGKVLHGYGLHTRVFEWQEGRAYHAWGADYTPDPMSGPLWLNERLFGNGYDSELGAPGTPMGEAWLSIARKAGKAATAVTRFAYSTGERRGLAPFVDVIENTFDVPFGEITLNHIRGGLGYWRGAPDHPRPTANLHDADRLAAAVQIAASHVIALG